MATHRVILTMQVSAVVDVEAETVAEALEAVYDSPDMPSGITIGAFGSANVDESGEWEPTEVLRENKVVWTEGKDVT